MADTADRVARIPIADRPRFARKMIAVWRLHHLAAGEDLAVLVPPGEWPDDVEPQVKGVPVVQTAGMGGDGSVVVIGRKAGAWYVACNIAAAPLADFTAENLAITTVYIQVADKRTMIWLHPAAHDGAVPMWEVDRG